MNKYINLINRINKIEHILLLFHLKENRSLRPGYSSLPPTVTGNYNFETASMTSILEQLGWESLQKRRKGIKLILLFKGLKERASMPCDDLQPPNRHSVDQLQTAFEVPYARTDIYNYTFFQYTIRDWNALPASILSSAESSEDSVARFTSLVRSRDVFVGPGE